MTWRERKEEASIKEQMLYKAVCEMDEHKLALKLTRAHSEALKAFDGLEIYELRSRLFFKYRDEGADKESAAWKAYSDAHDIFEETPEYKLAISTLYADEKAWRDLKQTPEHKAWKESIDDLCAIGPERNYV